MQMYPDVHKVSFATGRTRQIVANEQVRGPAAVEAQ
jgi:hypothetical protein